MRPGDWRKWLPLTLVSLALAACSSSPSAATGSSTTPGPTASTPSNPPSAASSPSPSPAASKGPATAQFSITGTAGLTGPVTAQTITCDRPSLNGPEIDYIGLAGTNGPMIVIFAQAGHVEVRAGTGSAATLRLRTFVGTGVTSFDSATGLVLDTKLT